MNPDLLQTPITSFGRFDRTDLLREPIKRKAQQLRRLIALPGLKQRFNDGQQNGGRGIPGTPEMCEQSDRRHSFFLRTSDLLLFQQSEDEHRSSQELSERNHFRRVQGLTCEREGALRISLAQVDFCRDCKCPASE